MIILGIDPGPEKSAYVTWDSQQEIILAMDILSNDFFISDNNYFEQIIIHRFSEIQHPFEIDILAIEFPKIFGKKVWQQVIETAFFAGRIIQKAKIFYKRIAPSEWKLYIAGHRGANDQLVRQALMARFGPKGTKKKPGKLYGLKTHLWDALGIAVYMGDTIKNEQL